VLSACVAHLFWRSLFGHDSAASSIHGWLSPGMPVAARRCHTSRWPSPTVQIAAR